MDRSRSNKRNYYDHHQHPDYDSENYSRTKPRFSAPGHHYNYPNNNRQYHRSNSGGSVGAGGRLGGKPADSSTTASTNFRILCHDAKVGGVIGKSGSIIKAIRQHTGAWINVHELAPGDDERIIEISDTRRRDPDGRLPSFSPAQEALLLVHERILESEPIGVGSGSGGGYSQHHGGGGRYGDEEMDYGGIRGGGGGNKEVTRLVVSRMHVGSLMGKGGKIIEQMRMETKTHIRILPRSNTLPRCVSLGEEIVQVVGDVNALKKAISVISSRLRESQHRDRAHFQGRFHSDDRYADDDTIPHNSSSRRSLDDGDGFNSRLLSGSPNNRKNYDPRHSSNAYHSEVARDSHSSRNFEDLVFRILCPNDRIDSIFGESNGIIGLLQDEIGVDVKVSGPEVGLNERILVILSDEGPDDELFPAQEALLHIQTHILDLVPDKENIVTTRLLVPTSDIGCLNEGKTALSHIKEMTGADIEILPRDKVPPFVTAEDELVQIVGEIKSAREAVIEVTARLRNNLYKDYLQRDTPPLADVAPRSSRNLSVEVEANASKIGGEGHWNTSTPTSENVKTRTKEQSPKPKEVVVSNTEKPTSNEYDQKGTTKSSSNRIQVPLVTRSTLEVVIPEYAVTKLLAKQKHKLGQISELSGAKVTIVEDDPEETGKAIRISGTPEQAERAQSLLQGFLLSIQEDGP